jgi:hypothetical protein
MDGWTAWSVAWLQASSQLPKPGAVGPRGRVLTLPIHLENPRGDDFFLCVRAATDSHRILAKAKTPKATLTQVDRVLWPIRYSLHQSFRKHLPLRTRLSPHQEWEWAQAGKALLWTAQDDQNSAEVRGSLALSGYALIGAALTAIPPRNEDQCVVCGFRTALHNKRYCREHRLSREIKGEENPYAARLRSMRINPMCDVAEAELRIRYSHYLIGLSTNPIGWDRLLDAFVVTDMAVAWIKDLLETQPQIKLLLGEEFVKYLGKSAWKQMFSELRRRVDPGDDRNDLDIWCEKLMRAAAWLSVEDRIKGNWSPGLVVGQNGTPLRSGQHVGGKRGPKGATLEKMRAALTSVRHGQSLLATATSLGVTSRTVKQWAHRHSDFGEQLNFYLRRTS